MNAENRNLEHKPPFDFRRLIVRAMVVLLGIVVGAIWAVIIAFATGLIPLVC